MSATPYESGVTEFAVNEVQEMPVGRGATHDSVTDGAVPDVSFAVTVEVPEPPAVMLTAPLFDRV
jgi:hypothetical protein